MDVIIQPGLLQGKIAAIPSKSQAHRLLICAAFADNATTLVCPERGIPSSPFKKLQKAQY